MCDILAGASLAITAAQAIAQYQGQSAMAKALGNQDVQQAGYINDNLRSQYQQGQQQIQYRDDGAWQKEWQNAQQTRAAQATALTSAGEAGVTGNSINALANEYGNRAAEFDSDVEYNRQAQDNEIMLQMQGFQTDARSQINRLPIPNQPSLLGTALQIGAGALGSYNTFLNPRLPKDATNDGGYDVPNHGA